MFHSLSETCAKSETFTKAARKRRQRNGGEEFPFRAAATPCNLLARSVLFDG